MSAARFHLNAIVTGRVVLPAQEARHAASTRRLSVNERIMVFDGVGHEAEAVIIAINSRGVEISVGEPCFRHRPRPELTLATALPKGPRQDVLLEKCTELGVAVVQPLRTDRSVVEAAGRKRNRLQRKAIEAAKQSGQCWVPTFAETADLRAVLEWAGAYDLVVAGVTEEPRPEGMLSGAGLLAEARRVQRMLALVGPEGGWSPSELEALRVAGVRGMSLGPNVLRVETAAIVFAALAHAAACED